MDTLNTWTGKKDRKIPRKKGRIIKSNKIERKRKEKNRTNVGVGMQELKGREMSRFYFICLKFWPKQPESPTMAQQMFMGKLN